MSPRLRKMLPATESDASSHLLKGAKGNSQQQGLPINPERTDIRQCRAKMTESRGEGPSAHYTAGFSTQQTRPEIGGPDVERRF